MSNPRTWLPSGGAFAGVVGAFFAFLFIGMPMMVVVLQSGGGCEGLPRPREPDDTALYIALVALILLVVGTWCGVRRLVNFFYHGN